MTTGLAAEFLNSLPFAPPTAPSSTATTATTASASLTSSPVNVVAMSDSAPRSGTGHESKHSVEIVDGITYKEVKKCCDFRYSYRARDAYGAEQIYTYRCDKVHTELWKCKRDWSLPDPANYKGPKQTDMFAHLPFGAMELHKFCNPVECLMMHYGGNYVARRGISREGDGKMQPLTTATSLKEFVEVLEPYLETKEGKSEVKMPFERAIKILLENILNTVLSKQDEGKKLSSWLEGAVKWSWENDSDMLEKFLIYAARQVHEAAQRKWKMPSIRSLYFGYYRAMDAREARGDVEVEDAPQDNDEASWD